MCSGERATLWRHKIAHVFRFLFVSGIECSVRVRVDLVPVILRAPDASESIAGVWIVGSSTRATSTTLLKDSRVYTGNASLEVCKTGDAVSLVLEAMDPQTS